MIRYRNHAYRCLCLAAVILAACTDARPEKSAAATNAVLFEPALFEPGVISTGDYDTHPAFSPSGDTLYFLKCTPDINACTICVSYKKAGRWTAPVIASFSGRYTDVDPFVTKDGNTLYFASDRPIHPGESIRTDWDIWKTERTSAGWSAPVHLDTVINSPESEYYPTQTDDGTLYFSSGRKGGLGGADIYCCRLVNGKYTVREHLSSAVNTACNEYEPFIAPDESYLLFMATIPNGLGNGDIYISCRQNGQWSPARKLPPPINTSASEWSPKVTRDGKYLFFGSARSIPASVPSAPVPLRVYKQTQLYRPGNGLGDIYYMNFSAF
ncbi:PD40 domain-containing protein [Chitinophaga pendula]|uniref:PD40 domain-containing protein n=1 Tax=Chitinophaga TaxID=79328 RepID=UPI000BB02219|nr:MULTISPECIES: PD40 domain-containing protein [Chitinophaga]ASZ13230.1 hypothetical protein CK934_20820 [Chitinophaga sp. MD30]UCJ09151.1 PD40 domain-containing protein [Chitinophaga pendula]